MIPYSGVPGFGGQRASPTRHTDLVRFWVIVSITISIIGITYIAMAEGYGAVVPQLFYFPILYTSYFYPARGIYVGGCCAAAYLIIAASFIGHDMVVVSGVLFQTLLFLGIAAGSAWVVHRQGERRFILIEDEPGAIHAMIRGGESDHVEFKRRALWSTDLTKEEIAASESGELRRYRNNASKFIVARALAGFLNTDGGDLLIGVWEDRINNSIQITGIEDDYPKLHEEDRNPDGYRRMIVEAIVRKYLPDIFDMESRFLQISFPLVSGRTLCHIHISPAEKPVFVNTGSEEIFFIRTDASTRPISGKSLTDYILARFTRV